MADAITWDGVHYLREANDGDTWIVTIGSGTLETIVGLVVQAGSTYLAQTKPPTSLTPFATLKEATTWIAEQREI
jgi:hypothetical protein